jgi:probable phosphoglycerate mutase
VVKARRLRVIVEADGGARGNPGPAGWGALVREAATGEVLVEMGESIGVATNNVAEYSGLIAGLRSAADLGAVEVEVRMDSKLVVEQMSGRWQIKHPGLRPLAAQAASIVTRFESVRFTWVPREQNVAADALANAAMDAAGAVGAAVSREDRAEPGPPARWAPPSEEGAARLILVRHGSTSLTAERRYSGRGDVPLAPEGEAQSRAVASRVAAMAADGVAAVVSSPLLRCRRTAELIAAKTDAAVTVDDSFVECDFGAWEGLTFAEVQKIWPDELNAWLASPAVAPPGGESFAEVTARVRPAVARLTAAHAGRVVVVVTHVTPIKLVLRDALAATDGLLHRLFLDAAGISVVDFWPDGGIAVRTINDTAHLND